MDEVGGVGGVGPWDDVVGIGPPCGRPTAREPASLVPGIEGVAQGFGDRGVTPSDGHDQGAVGDDGDLSSDRESHWLGGRWWGSKGAEPPG